MSYEPVNKPLSWFRANPENYRAHPEPQIEVLRESLRRFGTYKNVVARPDGTLLAGHGVVEAALAEGLTELPVHIFAGSEEEARALLVADNEIVRRAQDDPDQLSQLLESLRADGLMQVTGHDDESLAALLQEVAEPPVLLDFSSYGKDDQDGGGSAWGGVGQSDNVRLVWGEIEAALPHDLYDRVYALLMASYDAGSSFGAELSLALTTWADERENSNH